LFSRLLSINREFDVSRSLHQSILAAQMKSVDIPFQSPNFWILNRKQIGFISANLSAKFEIARLTLEFARSDVARSIFAVALCRSIKCRSIYFSSTDEFWSINYEVDQSISLGRFSKWQGQTWTLEVMEIILDVFSGLSRMFWTSFQLRPVNKTKHKNTTKHYIYNTNYV
jgi:hypothetical protein